MRVSAWCVVLFVSLLSVAASAQEPPQSSQQAAPQAQPAPERSDPDVRVDPLQPDFTLAALPTTLRMPKGKAGFRVTHRFTRNLGRGDFGDLASDFFGLDLGAVVGLEVRYGLLPGTQIAVHRTSDRTIQILGQHNFANERDGAPLGFDALVTLEGADNLSEHHQSTVGVILSRNLWRHVAVYGEPLVVFNSNPFEIGDEHTFMLGLGARFRFRPSMYLMAEYTPRLAGYTPQADQMSFAWEARAGGHLFQISVSNGFGTTFGQLARGGVAYDQWFLGFNISRKFF